MRCAIRFTVTFRVGFSAQGAPGFQVIIHPPAPEDENRQSPNLDNVDHISRSPRKIAAAIDEEFHFLFSHTMPFGPVALLALLLLLAGCRDVVESRHPDGKARLVRTYSLLGGRDSLHLEREQSFHFNGKPERDARYRKGRLDGPYSEYWSNGQKRTTGRYVEGKRQGEWEVYYNQFSVAAKGAYRDDLKDGPWIELYENGELKSQGEYRQGREVGTWKQWGRKGDLLVENSCFEANAEGRYRSFHAADTPKDEHACRNGLPVGPFVRRNPEGDVEERGTFDSTGKRDGLWETFHPGGIPATRRSYRHGEPADSLWAWDARGRLRERGFFAEGRGEVLAYDSLGRLSERRPSVNGSPNGETWGYHPDGRKKSRVVYADGVPLSLERWHANGRLAAEGRFDKGKRTGEWKQFDARGRPQELAFYVEGRLHGERRLFDTTGRLIQVQRYERGYPAEGKFPGGIKPKFQNPAR
jgi:uncharacterized protein